MKHLLWGVLMYTNLFSLITNAQNNRTAARTCADCKPENCPIPRQCLAGYVPDRCGCCQICARLEHELCDISTEDNRYGICGENLECRSRKFDGGDDGEYTCMCKEDKMICSNEGKTYPTICSLNEEAIEREEYTEPRDRNRRDTYESKLFMEYWGPCKEAPVIISAPENSYGPLGANLTLDCEARGFPAPTITWQFVSTEGKTISLPSDDQYVAIQMRGGPEPLMVTGWMQIMSLDPSYIGTYHCIATNSLGQVYSLATVGVYKNEEF